MVEKKPRSTLRIWTDKIEAAGWFRALRILEVAAVLVALTAFGIDLYFREIEREQQRLERQAWQEERAEREADRQVRVAQLYLQMSEASRYNDRAGKIALARTVEILVKQRLPMAGMDLSGVNFSGLYLSGADFRGANLAGSDFTGANLCAADLSYANFSGATLTNTLFVNARIDGTNLESAVSLTDKQLERTCIHGEELPLLPSDIVMKPLICPPASFQHLQFRQGYVVNSAPPCGRQWWHAWSVLSE